MRHDGGKNINSSYSGESNKNRRNSNNTTTKNKCGGGSGGIIFSGNTSGGVNKNRIQLNPGTISKGCLACGNEVYCLKVFQKGYVPRLLHTEVKGPTTVTTLTGTFDIWQRCKRCYNKGNKYHHNTDTNCSKTNSSHHWGGYELGNLAIDQSGQNNSGTTTYAHPDDAIVFHKDWHVLHIHERGLGCCTLELNVRSYTYCIKLHVEGG